MDTKTFFEKNDIAVKMRAALEQIVVGQGYVVFRGLEDGMCIVKISYDGANLVFQNMMPIVEVNQAVPVEIATTGPNDSALHEPAEADFSVSTEVSSAAVRRKGKHGSRNETE